MQKPLFIYKNEEKSIDTSLIVYVQSDVNYSCFRLSNGTKILVAKTLKVFEHRLQGQKNFIRLSKSCIINTHFLKTYDQDSRRITLMNGYSVLVSRRRTKNIQAILNSFF